MFISVLELFKIGIGPSSSHTMGPMVAASDFRNRILAFVATHVVDPDIHVRCTLKGSLAFTGKGHAADRAVALGLHGYSPEGLADQPVNELTERLWHSRSITLNETLSARFCAAEDVVFDRSKPLPQHPNGMIFELLDPRGKAILVET